MQNNFPDSNWNHVKRGSSDSTKEQPRPPLPIPPPCHENPSLCTKRLDNELRKMKKQRRCRISRHPLVNVLRTQRRRRDSYDALKTLFQATRMSEIVAFSREKKITTYASCPKNSLTCLTHGAISLARNNNAYSR